MNRFVFQYYVGLGYYHVIYPPVGAQILTARSTKNGLIVAVLQDPNVFETESRHLYLTTSAVEPVVPTGQVFSGMRFISAIDGEYGPAYLFEVIFSPGSSS